jgi:hypothetical protein
MHQLGIQDVSPNFIVASQGKLDEDGINVAVFAKKSPFTPGEEAAVEQHITGHEPLRLMYSPSHHLPNAFTSLIESNDPAGFSRNYAYNVSPVDDDDPFFFFTLKPSAVFHLGGQQSMDRKVNLGVAVLAMLLLISVAAVLAFLVLPLLLERQRSSMPSSLLYFVAVGLGYILVEVAFIQRFVLFLGHPTYALTVVVFLMLISSGAGSVLSKRWLSDYRQVWGALAFVIGVVTTYVFVLPLVLERTVGAPFGAKLGISALLLAPLGLAMGIPFPTGLRAMADVSHSSAHETLVEWAWAMNAAASVLGSVLSIVIAIEFGLNVTLVCGAMAYVVALMLTKKLRLPS